MVCRDVRWRRDRDECFILYHRCFQGKAEICGYQTFLHLCSAVMERLGWGLRGQHRSLELIGMYPEKTRSNLNAFFLVCVCVEGEDSLLIWLLQSVVFPVVCWCFRQWLWGIEIQPLKWLYILWKSCYKVLMRQIFVLPRRALWLVKGDSYCHAGESSYHVYQCCASVSLCTLWSFFNLCWGVGGTISLCMFTPAGAQLGRLRTLRKYIWKYFQSKLSCRHIKCVYALL